MHCIVIEPIHLHGHRVEPGSTVALEPGVYDRLRKAGCVRTVAEHETLTQARIEADRYVAEAQAAAEKEREAKLAEARELAEKARAEAEAGEPDPASDDAPRRGRRHR